MALSGKLWEAVCVVGGVWVDGKGEGKGLWRPFCLISSRET